MIKIIRYDEKPITLIGECVGNCYGSDTSNPIKNYKRGKQCILDGHGRVEEYPDVIMEIDGYSIKVAREFYTHVIGTTRTQESTRYVNMKERGYFTPPKITENANAEYIYRTRMKMIFQAYEDLVTLGIPKEDASMVLPLGMNTKFVVKINVRALLNMAQVRMCTRAYHEYRKLMNEVRNELCGLSDEWKEIANMMKPKCEVHGYCEERHSCGRKPRKEEELEELKRENELLIERIKRLED